MNVKMHAEQITRLLDNSPPHGSANPVQRFAGFMSAAEDYELHILRAAVDGYIKDRWIPSVEKRFPVTAPQLAHECRRLLNIELADRDRTAGAILQIEQREEIFHEDPPMLRKMAVQEHLARAVVLHKPEATPEQVAEQQAATKAYLANHDAKFVDTSPEATARRLYKAKI